MGDPNNLRDGASRCPVCDGTGIHDDLSCGFCMGLKTVTGHWRENYAQLQAKGSWAVTTPQYDAQGHPDGFHTRVLYRDERKNTDA